MNYQLKCLVSLIIVKTSKFINSLSKLIINFIPPTYEAEQTNYILLNSILHIEELWRACAQQPSGSAYLYEELD